MSRDVQWEAGQQYKVRVEGAVSQGTLAPGFAKATNYTQAALSFVGGVAEMTFTATGFTNMLLINAANCAADLTCVSLTKV
jgi:hypothetical protein